MPGCVIVISAPCALNPAYLELPGTLGRRRPLPSVFLPGVHHRDLGVPHDDLLAGAADIGVGQGLRRAAMPAGVFEAHSIVGQGSSTMSPWRNRIVPSGWMIRSPSQKFAPLWWNGVPLPVRAPNGWVCHSQ